MTVERGSMVNPNFPIDTAWLERVLDASRALGMVCPERMALIGSDQVAHVSRTSIRCSTEGDRIYLHQWRASEPRDMHDHPWDCASLILTEGYWEITPEGRFCPIRDDGEAADVPAGGEFTL